MIVFFKNLLEELKKIKLPSRQEVISLSIGVVVALAASMTVFYFLDILISFIINKVIIGL